MDQNAGPNPGILHLTTFLFQVYTASRAAGFEHPDAMEIVKMSFTWMMERGQQRKKDQSSGDLDEVIKRFFSQEGTTPSAEDDPST